MTAASAYIADVTPPEKRAAAFGMIGSAFGLGFMLGPAIGGVVGNINPRLTFWAAAAFALLNTLYGLFVLPESLPHEGARAHRSGSAPIRSGRCVCFARITSCGA